MSPEVLKGDIQGYGVDIWALGVFLYEMIHKKTPFFGRTSHQLLDDIKKERIEFGKKVSVEAKDLIK